MTTSDPRIVLASDDMALRVRIGQAAEGLAGVVSVPPGAAGLLQSLVDSRPALVLVGLDRATNLQMVVGLVRRADPVLPIVAVGDPAGAEVVLAAIRAGASDFLDIASSPEALRADLARLIRSRAEAPRPAAGGFELIVSAQPGGVESLFAVNLAAARAAAGRETLLIDCALPMSEAPAALDLRVPYTVQNAVRDASRLDRTLAVSALARHEETGLLVLPLATAAQPDVEGVSAESLAGLVGVLRPLIRETLLAAGGVRSPDLLREFMRAATRTYFLCPQKFTAVVDGQRLLGRIDPGEEAIARTLLVVDEYQPAISLTPEQMRQALALPECVRLPASRVELLNGLNTGRPLVLEQPRGAFAQALARLGPGAPRLVSSPPALRVIGETVAMAREKVAAWGGR